MPILQEQPLTHSLLMFVVLSPSPSATSVAVSGRNFGGRFSDRDFNWKWIAASKACHLAVTCAHYCLFCVSAVVLLGPNAESYCLFFRYSPAFVVTWIITND